MLCKSVTSNSRRLYHIKHICHFTVLNSCSVSFETIFEMYNNGKFLIKVKENLASFAVCAFWGMCGCSLLYLSEFGV